jgi:hypothetical protein
MKKGLCPVCIKRDILIHTEEHQLCDVIAQSVKSEGAVALTSFTTTLCDLLLPISGSLFLYCNF